MEELKVKKNNNKYKIKRINEEYLNDIVELHMKIFEEYFLTKLGREIVKCLYRGFIEEPGYGIIATTKDNCVIGFAVGMIDRKRFYKEFYRKNILNIIKEITKSFIRNASIRKKIIIKSYNAIYSMIIDCKGENENKIEEKNRNGSLLSIGIDSKYYNTGLADKIMEEYCMLMGSEGCERISLCVYKNNKRAINFYKKNGLKIWKENEESVYYYKKIIKQ